MPAHGLGGSEVSPASFQPFGGLGPEVDLRDGTASPPEAPGIGLETRPQLAALFLAL